MFLGRIIFRFHVMAESAASPDYGLQARCILIDTITMYKAIRTYAFVSVCNQVAGIFRIGLNSRLWHVENAYTTYGI
jgi:hypothetical protein